MKTADILFRTVNGVAAVANGYSFAVPIGSYEYVACKAVTVACDAISFLTLYSKNAVTQHRADEYKIPPGKATKNYVKFVAHQASCLLAGITDFRALGTFFGMAIVPPEQQMIGNGMTMTVQALNAMYGSDPQKIAAQVDRYGM